jgi:hypothetical protein
MSGRDRLVSSDYESQGKDVSKKAFRDGAHTELIAVAAFLGRGCQRNLNGFFLANITISDHN